MTSEELKKAYMTNEQLGQDEVEEITKMIAKSKRCIEILYLLPYAKEEMEADVEAFKEKYDLQGVDVEGLKYITDGETAKKLVGLSEENALKEMPYQAFRYRQYTINKLVKRDELLNKLNVPKNSKMKKWRERQIERSKGYSGGAYSANVQICAAYEITDGCSVGCPFCGIGAENLKKVFTYDKNNVELFKDVISMMHEVIGDAAGRGPLYMACEPLDNRDYEKFLEDFFEEFGILPQITTAIPLRDINRMKALLHQLNDDKGGMIYRFSVKSVKEAEDIFNNFSAEELLRVELLPQFEEAPGFNGFAKTGREREKELEENDCNEKLCECGEEAPKKIVATICCISGFVINFARKDVRLVTPYPACDKYPDGENVLEKRTFTDSEDLRQIILELIDKYMVTSVPSDKVLKPYDYFEINNVEELGEVVMSGSGYARPITGPFKGFADVTRLIFEGVFTKKQIAEILYKTKKISVTETYFCITTLFKNGIINEYDW